MRAETDMSATRTWYSELRGPWRRNLRHLDRWDYASIVGIWAIYLSLQIFWLLRALPVTGGDQLDYFSVAGGVQEVQESHRHMRIGLTLPVRLLVTIFDYSQASYYIIPIFGGLIFASATYLLGALIHTRIAGILASVIATFNAHIFWESSHLLPDLLAAGLFAAAVVMTAGTKKHESSSEIPVLLLAGLLFAWSYLAREYIALFFPLVGALLWQCGKGIRDALLVAAGAIGGLLLELAYSLILFGHPFARIGSVVSRATPTLGTPAPGEGAGPEAENSFLDTAMILPHQLLDREGGWLLLSLGLALVVVSGHAVLRRRELLGLLLLPLFWFVLMYGLMTLFGWTSTEDGRSVIRISKVRYWFPVFPAIAVGGAIAVLSLLDPLLRRAPDFLVDTTHVMLAVVVIGSSYAGLSSIAHSGSFVRNGGNSEFEEFRSWLVEEGGKVDNIWVDSGHGRALDRIAPAFTVTPFGRPIWNGSLRPLAVGDPPSENQIDGLVVFHRLSNEWLASRDQLPAYAAEVPTGWVPQVVSSNGMLAMFDSRGSWGIDRPLDSDDGREGDVSSATSIGGPLWALGLTEGERQRLTLSARTGGAPRGGDSTPRGYRIELFHDFSGGGTLTVSCDFEDASTGRSTRQMAFSPNPATAFSDAHYCFGPGVPVVELDARGEVVGELQSGRLVFG